MIVPIREKERVSDEKSFEDYPWPTLDDVDLFDYEYVSEHLPEGMGMDAKHSFEDKGWSVIDFYKEHSDKAATVFPIMCRLRIS